MERIPPPESRVSLENLYPGHTPEEYREAEQAMRDYVATCLLIVRRIKDEPAAWKQLRALTKDRPRPNLDDEQPRTP